MFKELSVVTNCLRPKGGPLKSEILVVFNVHHYHGGNLWSEFYYKELV